LIVVQEVQAAITVARDKLLKNADKIGDPAYRKSFLENVPENARTLALARAWVGERETDHGIPPSVRDRLQDSMRTRRQAAHPDQHKGTDGGLVNEVMRF